MAKRPKKIRFTVLHSGADTKAKAEAFVNAGFTFTPGLDDPVQVVGGNVVVTVNDNGAGNDAYKAGIVGINDNPPSPDTATNLAPVSGVPGQFTNPVPVGGTAVLPPNLPAPGNEDVVVYIYPFRGGQLQDGLGNGFRAYTGSSGEGTATLLLAMPHTLFAGFSDKAGDFKAWPDRVTLVKEPGLPQWSWVEPLWRGGPLTLVATGPAHHPTFYLCGSLFKSPLIPADPGHRLRPLELRFRVSGRLTQPGCNGSFTLVVSE